MTPPVAALLAAVCAQVVACGATAAATPSPTPALRDPCGLVGAADIHNDFILGVRGDVTRLNDDPSSRSCEITVHDVNGDEHLTVTDVANGGPAIATLCDPNEHPGLVALNVGSRGCWNPNDLSASSEQHGVVYSVAILDHSDPTDYAHPLETLLTGIVKHA